MQSHARSRYPSQLCIRRIRELAIESQVIQNTGLTARGYHIHGSGQEPVKDFHGSPDLVSYGPPVASRQNVGLGFFFLILPWLMDPSAPFGILLAIYRTRV